MLSDDLTRHVDLHRGLGFRFRTQHGLLRSFVRFAKEHGDIFIHADRALDWASQAPSPPQRRNRLVTVRRFALALHAEEPRHEVAPADALGRATFRRRIPHIYAPDEITGLMEAAAALPPGKLDRPLIYTTLFGLLAATGTRISEALALRLDDITADGLIIRQTKFHKSRLLPLHDTTRSALDRYVLAPPPDGIVYRNIVCLRQRRSPQRQHSPGSLPASDTRTGPAWQDGPAGSSHPRPAPYIRRPFVGAMRTRP